MGGEASVVSSSSGCRRGVGVNHADGGSSRSRGVAQGNWGNRSRGLWARGEENGSAAGPAC
jgi:hypothetical protein